MILPNILTMTRVLDTIQVFVRVKQRSIHGLAHSNSGMCDRDPTILRLKSFG